MVTVTGSKKCSRTRKLLRNFLKKEQNPNVVQFCIAPFVKDELITYVEKTPYSFKFDETTTSQVKKQYNRCVSFFSKILHEIVTSYCGFLFVGHCTADDLVDHFYEFLRDLGLDLNLLLVLGIDSPNVNK